MANDEPFDEQLIDAVEQDLAGLIQDEGLTKSRLQSYGKNIMKLYSSANAGFVIDAMRRVFENMEPDKYWWAFKVGMSMDSESRHTTLSDRRESLRALDGFDKSDDTLRRWERRAMKTLARNLVVDARSKRIGSGSPEEIEFVSKSVQDHDQRLSDLEEELLQERWARESLADRLLTVSLEAHELAEILFLSRPAGQQPFDLLRTRSADVSKYLLGVAESLSVDEIDQERLSRHKQHLIDTYLLADRKIEGSAHLRKFMGRHNLTSD